MQNVNSAKLRELATELRQETPLTEPAAKTTLAVAASAVLVLASIHELLSDDEFSSDTFNHLQVLFDQHGVPLFNHDGACDEAQLRMKYGDLGHPKHTVKDWKTAVHTDTTTMGYWEWVDLQLSVGE